MWYYAPLSAPANQHLVPRDTGAAVATTVQDRRDIDRRTRFYTWNCDMVFFTDAGRELNASLRYPAWDSDCSDGRINVSAKQHCPSLLPPTPSPFAFLAFLAQVFNGPYSSEKDPMATTCDGALDTVQSQGTQFLRLNVKRSGWGPGSAVFANATTPGRGVGTRVADITSGLVGPAPLPLTFFVSDTGSWSSEDFAIRLLRVDSRSSSPGRPDNVTLVQGSLGTLHSWTWEDPEGDVGNILERDSGERAKLQVVAISGAGNPAESVVEESAPFYRPSELGFASISRGSVFAYGEDFVLNASLDGNLTSGVMLSPVLLNDGRGTPTRSSSTHEELETIFLSEGGIGSAEQDALRRPGSGFVLAAESYVGGIVRNLTVVEDLFVANSAARANASQRGPMLTQDPPLLASHSVLASGGLRRASEQEALHCGSSVCGVVRVAVWDWVSERWPGRLR